MEITCDHSFRDVSRLGLAKTALYSRKDRFVSQGDALDMAYMDIRPSKPNGRTAVLLHGKNFCSATWQATVAMLCEAEYRIIAPDQIGFCKSSKPAHYQFSFQQLAANTHALLISIGVNRAVLIGHSTGGMLAVRYALMYPETVDQLVLVDPIGLEDWKAKGVPWQSVDTWYQQEFHTSPTAFAIMNERPTTPEHGCPAMSGGCRCWPGCIAVPGANKSPGIQRFSTT